MPACFSLISRDTGEAAIFQHIDDALRVHLSQPADPDRYLKSWYNIVGLYLACGRTWNEVFDALCAPADNYATLTPEQKTADDTHREEWFAILAYLSDRYEPSAWYSRAKHSPHLPANDPS